MPKRWRSNAAANLDHFYDDLMTGEPAPQYEVDPEIAVVATRLYQAGRRSAAPRPFKEHLWEDLMQSSVVSTNTGFTGPRPPTASPPVRQTFPHSTWHGRARPFMQAAVAALLLIGLIGAILPRFDLGGEPERSVNAPLFSASPEADARPTTGDLALPEDCTTHVLRLNEIAAMLSSVDRDVMYEGGQQRPTGPEHLRLQQTTVTFADDATVDSTLVAEIQPVFDMYFACGSADSVRQQFYLMTPSGVVQRLINPNGQPVWGNIVRLGVSPNPNPLVAHLPAITATQQLADGRIAVRYQFQYTDGSMSGPSTMIFRNIDGTWYIDEYQCGICG